MINKFQKRDNCDNIGLVRFSLSGFPLTLENSNNHSFIYLFAYFTSVLFYFNCIVFSFINCSFFIIIIIMSKSIILLFFILIQIKIKFLHFITLLMNVYSLYDKSSICWHIYILIIQISHYTKCNNLFIIYYTHIKNSYRQFCHLSPRLHPRLNVLSMIEAVRNGKCA